MFATYSVPNHVSSGLSVDTTTATSITTPSSVNPETVIAEEAGFLHGGMELSYVPLVHHTGIVGQVERHNIVNSQHSLTVASHNGFVPTTGAASSSHSTYTHDSHPQQTQEGNWFGYSTPPGAVYAEAPVCFDAHADLHQPNLNFVGVPTPAYCNNMRTRPHMAAYVAGAYPSQSFDVYSPAGVSSCPPTSLMWSPVHTSSSANVFTAYE